MNAPQKPTSAFRRSVKRCPLLYGVLSGLRDHAFTLRGFFGYYLGRRRSIALVYSSMRTGSTLFKSLIGEADDVSLMDEFNFLPYLGRNKYLFYGLVSSLARERVILLKKPYNNNPDHLKKYGCSPLSEAKKIILYRDPYDTLCSLRNLQIRRNRRRFDDTELVEYWCDCYENLLENTRDEDVLVVRYEDITEHPVELTAEIFPFIGSSRKEGVESYGAYEWVGGRDDISDQIKSLKVAKAKVNSREENPGLFDMVKQSSRVKRILQHLDAARFQVPG